MPDWNESPNNGRELPDAASPESLYRQPCDKTNVNFILRGEPSFWEENLETGVYADHCVTMQTPAGWNLSRPRYKFPDI